MTSIVAGNVERPGSTAPIRAPEHGAAEREARLAVERPGQTASRVGVTVADRTAAERLTPRTPGHAMAASVQAAMEARVGHRLSDIRIHADEEAGQLAAAAEARAYTVGPDIVFGRDRYQPGRPEGAGLLVHEIHHVLQQHQTGGRAVLRDDAKAPAPTPAPTAAPPDPELALGQRLVRDFPSGIALAFYAPMPYDKEAAQDAATRWAARENALAIKGKAVKAGNVVFGRAMLDDDHPLTATVQAIGTMLSSAVAKAPPNPAVPPGIGPATVRTLAVFAHGTTDWCGLGSITSSKAASVIKAIAPNLAPNVNVILYSCNAGRNPDDSEEWIKGTMQGGGSKSLAAVTRDALIAEGKTGSVWGHTTTGHVTENFALREFDATAGKGSAGTSFVSTYVFGGGYRVELVVALTAGLLAKGLSLTSPKATDDIASAAELEMYKGYAAANKDLTFAGGKLAESAPVHPVDVGKAIKAHWDTTYWPARRDKAIEALAKSLLKSGRAKKAASAPPKATP
jgi:hypothetical protein